jgi:hypothetical protein
MANKRISFSAEDTGVVSLMDKLRQSAKDLSRDVIADAIKYSSSTKEQNAYISEQIKLIEKRNALEKEGRIMTARQSYNSAMETASSKEAKDKITQKYKQEIAGIREESGQDSMQTKLLQEIIDTIKASAKEEIKSESKQNVEERGFFSRLFGGNKKNESDPEEEYKKSLREGNRGDKAESEQEQNRRSKIGQSSRAFNTAAGIGMQSNEIFMAAAAMALIPMVGSGLSMIAQRLIQGGDQLQKGRLAMGSIMRNPGVDMGKSGEMLGVDQAEFMTFAAQMSKNRGYSNEGYALNKQDFKDSVEGAALRLLGTEQAYGVSRGSLLGFDKLQRLDNNHRDTAGDVQNLIKYLKQEGAFGASGKDMASLEEYIGIQTSIMQDQSKRLEGINTNTNASVIAAFQRIGGTFANPLLAGERIGTMNNAITSPNNDFKQAMVYSTLRKIKPDADLFELRKMQEEGIFGEGVLSGVMKDLTNRGGSEGNKKIMLSEFFGLSNNQSEALFNAYSKNNNVFDSVASRNELFKKYGMTSDSQFVSEGAQYTGSIDRMNAKMTNRVAPLGEKMINTSEKYINEIEKNGLVSGVGTIFKDIGKEMADAFKGAMTSAVENIGEKVTETFEVVKKAVQNTNPSEYLNNPYMGASSFGINTQLLFQNTTKVPAKGK